MKVLIIKVDGNYKQSIDISGLKDSEIRVVKGRACSRYLWRNVTTRIINVPIELYHKPRKA